MSLLEPAIKSASVSLFAISILCMLFFFYKVIYHPNKSYGLLMILILVVIHFICSILVLIMLANPEDKVLELVNITLGKFAAYWIICLAFCHYSILKSFREKYKRPHFKTFMLLAGLASLTISCITNFERLIRWRGDFVILYIIAIICLAFISLSTYRFRQEIQFGVYNFAKAPASKLLRFSSVQFVFAVLYSIQDSLERLNHCPSENLAKDQTVICDLLDLSWAIIYQCWVWYAVLSNWRMFSIGEINENKQSSDSLLDSSMSKIPYSDLVSTV